MFKFIVSGPPISDQNRSLESDLARSRETVDAALRKFYKAISKEVSDYLDFVTQLHDPDLDADAGWMEDWLANEARRKIDQLRSRVNDWIITSREADSVVQVLEALLSLSERIKADGNRHGDSKVQIWQRVMTWVRQTLYSAEEALARRGLPTTSPIESTQSILRSMDPISLGCSRRMTVSFEVPNEFSVSEIYANGISLAPVAA
ncbi:MAG: hypothetical protein H5T95_11105 [Firmicutes bacterium]|nr:hypothetical protein [Bacillota bacterium]